MAIVPVDNIILQTPEPVLYYHIVDPSHLAVHALADGTALHTTYILPSFAADKKARYGLMRQYFESWQLGPAFRGKMRCYFACSSSSSIHCIKTSIYCIFYKSLNYLPGKVLVKVLQRTTKSKRKPRRSRSKGSCGGLLLI